MANMGVGLGSHKKKPKIVTLVTSNSNNGRSSKKSKILNQTLSIPKSNKDKHLSSSISKSHNNSALNSKYSTNMAVGHQASYLSIKKQK